MDRITLKIVGSGGSGLLSTGDILIECFMRSGLYFCSDREFPSLIKGGASAYHISISDEPIRSLSTHVDIMIAVDRVGSMSYLHELADGGLLLFGDERFMQVPGFVDEIQKRNIQTIYIPEYETPKQFGGNELMSNMLLLGALWRVMSGDIQILEDEVTKRFASKPVLLKIDLACVKHGFMLGEKIQDERFKMKNAQNGSLNPEAGILNPEAGSRISKRKGFDGNQIVALSAVHHGVRAYYAYPMSPSSQILMHLSNWASTTGMIVKQAEDEISVVQMALGSMYAGTRALCATSGGGFDLMVETISLAGMIETPLVVIDVQRPGPATGLPTWSLQADLNMAIHSGHGEFARLVMSLSDHESIFSLVGEAFNFAERFQIPVILLSEKSIAECRMSLDEEALIGVQIDRHLVTSPDELSKLVPHDRYVITDDGISKRWIPGSCQTYYYANSDEHREDGTITEDGAEIQAMQDKRLRKIETLRQSIPAPRLFGPVAGADISFVGWGSTLPVLRDIISLLGPSEKGKVKSEKLSEQFGTLSAAADELGIGKKVKINYLHFDYLWPLRTQEVDQFFADNPNVHLIESNSTGQLGTLIEDKTTHTFAGKYLKYDGRRIYLEDIISYITEKGKEKKEKRKVQN